jgi:YD repeat-containing protein
VTSTAVDDSGNATSVDASRGYTYDPNKANALVSVQNGSGGTIETYGYDGAGNLVNANGDVRTPNNVNQLSGYVWNGRGDATSTANYTLQWDAMDRPRWGWKNPTRPRRRKFARSSASIRTSKLSPRGRCPRRMF